jgi:hypothetical protein
MAQARSTSSLIRSPGSRPAHSTRYGSRPSRRIDSPCRTPLPKPVAVTSCPMAARRRSRTAASRRAGTRWPSSTGWAPPSTAFSVTLKKTMRPRGDEALDRDLGPRHELLDEYVGGQPAGCEHLRVVGAQGHVPGTLEITLGRTTDTPRLNCRLLGCARLCRWSGAGTPRSVPPKRPGPTGVAAGRRPRGRRATAPGRAADAAVRLAPGSSHASARPAAVTMAYSTPGTTFTRLDGRATSRAVSEGDSSAWIGAATTSRTCGRGATRERTERAARTASSSTRTRPPGGQWPPDRRRGPCCTRGRRRCRDRSSHGLRSARRPSPDQPKPPPRSPRSTHPKFENVSAEKRRPSRGRRQESPPENRPQTLSGPMSVARDDPRTCHSGANELTRRCAGVQRMTAGTPSASISSGVRARP